MVTLLAEAESGLYKQRMATQIWVAFLLFMKYNEGKNVNKVREMFSYGY